MPKLKRINLIPAELRKKAASGKRAVRGIENIRHKIIPAFLILVFSFSAARIFDFMVARQKVVKVKHAMDASKVKLNKMQAEYMRLEKLKDVRVKEETEVKKKLTLLLSTSSKNKRYSPLLTALSELTPKDLWINKCVINNSQVQISGSTMGNQIIVEFMNKMDGSGNFKNSRFVSCEKQITDTNIVYNFQIAADVVWEEAKHGSR